MCRPKSPDEGEELMLLLGDTERRQIKPYVTILMIALSVFPHWGGFLAGLVLIKVVPTRAEMDFRQEFND